MATSSKDHKKQVVIVGAGISGLSCAFKLSESAAFKEGLISVTVLEASTRPGGIIDTSYEQGCVVESGPDSFITNKPYMTSLANRLGIGEHVIPTQEESRGAMVVSGGRLLRLPEGFSLLAPTKILPFMESPILSLSGKLRALAEILVPVRGGNADESLADFVRRRFGRELFERIAQPMVAGIYVGDAEKLSASMTAERFVQLEKSTGSVIGGLVKGTAGGAASEGGDGDADSGRCDIGQSDAGVRYGLFCSFDSGMKLVIDTLMTRLAQAGIDVRLSTPVDAVSRSQESARWLVSARQAGADSAEAPLETLEADELVLALPARQSAALLQSSAPDLASTLDCIEAASSAVVNLIVDKADIGVELDAFGVVVPEIEVKKLGLSILAIAFASKKFRGRAPEGKMILRAFLGGSKNNDLLSRSDDELCRLVRHDLAKLIKLDPDSTPSYMRLHRWPNAMPQFHVGHRDLLARIDEQVAARSGLRLAGASYRGVGLPECVHSGEVSAEKILLAFTERQLVV
ncbi:MAG: protoporphyrinogen oxidase [Cyanobacteria bacterium SZAS LIN-3]|nr:protoporphyrinogen oxidase [Cyanobacteria bacterium SZAS LIN-3]